MATGTSSSRPQERARGFTLIEVAVVVLVIGITLSFAVSRLAGEDRSRALGDAGDAFTEVVALATEDAIITGRALGVRLDGRAYELVEWRDGEWLPRTGSEAMRRRLPRGFVIDVHDGGSREYGRPVVILDGSGEVDMLPVVIVDQATANGIILDLGRDGRLFGTLLSDDA